MKAIYLDSVQKLSERELPIPKPGKDQVLVKMKAVGICGSDVHYWHKGKIGSFVVKEPMILGHECAGVIEEAGSQVSGLKVGDRVVIEPGVPCYKCEYCMSGRYNLCPDMRFFATPPVDGSLVEYVVFDSSLVFKIPESIEDYGLATMVEPLAVGVFATTRIQPQFGDHAVVFGAGIIGIACMLAAKAVGCATVTVADIREDRLKKVKELGADKVINLKTDAMPEMAFDVGYEATGADACLAHLAKCMKSGSKVSLLGLGADMQTLPLVEFICREIMLVPSFRYANAYAQALHLIELNQDKLMSAITNRIQFSLKGVDEALNTAYSDMNACKVIVDF
jgi:L-iditol 2-dehydrogenase